MLPIHIEKWIPHPGYIIKENIVLFYLFLFFLAIVIFIPYFLYKKVKLGSLSKKEFFNILINSIIPSILILVIYYIFFRKSDEKFLRISIHNYEGIYFFIAILSAIIYFGIIGKLERLNLDIMYEAGFICILVGFATARLFTFLFWDSSFEIFKNPLVYFDVFNKGGVSVTGGMIGGIIAGFIYAKVKKLHFFYHIQFFIPAILLGQIIGRFGCFLNGDSGGRPTSMPWGVVFSNDSIAYSNFPVGTPLHPVQLYEMIANFILLVFLLLTGKNKWISERRVIWYACGYGLARFVIEFFRGDTEHFGPLPFFSTGQIVALFGILCGIGMLIWSIYNPEKLTPDESMIARAKD